jgi:hypothetical protein
VVRLRCWLAVLLPLWLVWSPQVASGQKPTHRWTPLTGCASVTPDGPVGFLRLEGGVLEFTGSRSTCLPHNGGIRVQSVTVRNPRWDRVVAITLYWRLYSEDGFDAPKAVGLLSERVFARPLEIHELGTIKPDLDFAGRQHDGARLEIGIERVVYDDGSVWVRPKLAAAVDAFVRHDATQLAVAPEPAHQSDRASAVLAARAR